MAADLSHRLGWISQEDADRARSLIRIARLPEHAPQMPIDTWMQLMGLDKKVEGGKIRFVLLKAIGKAVLTADVPTDLLYQTLEACSANA
jgi:3-dehydroquinate synthetase